MSHAYADQALAARNQASRPENWHHGANLSPASHPPLPDAPTIDVGDLPNFEDRFNPAYVLHVDALVPDEDRDDPSILQEERPHLQDDPTQELDFALTPDQTPILAEELPFSAECGDVPTPSELNDSAPMAANTTDDPPLQLSAEYADTPRQDEHPHPNDAEIPVERTRDTSELHPQSILEIPTILEDDTAPSQLWSIWTSSWCARHRTSALEQPDTGGNSPPLHKSDTYVQSKHFDPLPSDRDTQLPIVSAPFNGSMHKPIRRRVLRRDPTRLALDLSTAPSSPPIASVPNAPRLSAMRLPRNRPRPAPFPSSQIRTSSSGREFLPS